MLSMQGDMLLSTGLRPVESKWTSPLDHTDSQNTFSARTDLPSFSLPYTWIKTGYPHILLINGK